MSLTQKLLHSSVYDKFTIFYHPHTRAGLLLTDIVVPDISLVICPPMEADDQIQYICFSHKIVGIAASVVLDSEVYILFRM